MIRVPVVGAIAVSVWAWATPARAQPEPAPDAGAPLPVSMSPEPDPDDPDVRAKALYVEGDRAYAEGDYERSVKAFHAAYDLSRRPQLLYNLANSYERMGEYARAAELLRRYLESPEAVELDTIRKRIANLDMRAGARQHEVRELAVLRARPPCPKSSPCPEPVIVPESPRPWLAYSLVATGGAAFVAAALFGVASVGAAGDAEDDCADTPGGRLCLASVGDDLDRERRYAIVSDVALAAGAIAAGTGAYLLWQHYRGKREAEPNGVRVTPTAGSDGVGVWVGGAF